MPDDPTRPPAAALRMANDYLAAGRPFAAHEVLESAWKNRPAVERDLWQGLAQIAVGITHLQRGNERGAVALLQRGNERLAAALAAESSRASAGDLPPGWDPARVRRAVVELLALLAQGAPERAAGTARRLRLLA